MPVMIQYVLQLAHYRAAVRGIACAPARRVCALAGILASTATNSITRQNRNSTRLEMSNDDAALIDGWF